MSDRILVADPDEQAPAEPVSGLPVRTPFTRGSRRLDLARVAARDRSDWHRGDGPIFGWVRAGEGRIEYGPGAARSSRLERGDFLRVPADTVRRYAAGAEPLELLWVVDGECGATPADAPGDADSAPPAVVGPDSLVITVESANLTRETPFPGESVLLMRVRAAGGAAAGWHHHGENVYFGYAVDGPSETEFGPAGDRVARIERGECFHVPPGLVHRDTNPTDEAHTGIIWLCGGEPWVVNVEGPASATSRAGTERFTPSGR